MVPQMQRSRVIPVVSIVLLSCCGSLSFAASRPSALERLAARPGDTRALSVLKEMLESQADVDERARLAVIYYLGCVYTDQLDEAAHVRQWLAEHQSSEAYVKYLAPKFTGSPCEDCHSMGLLHVQCTRCRGRGRCRFCRGRGSVTTQGFDGRSHSGKCRHCRGSGKCPACEGKGRMDRECRSCGGKGHGPSRELIKQVYLSLLKGETPAVPGREDQLSPEAFDVAAASSDHTETYTLFRKRDWDGSPVYVRTGDEVHVLAPGGEGDRLSYRTDHGLKAPRGALLMKVGRSIHEVGGGRSITVRESGRLMFRQNYTSKPNKRIQISIAVGDREVSGNAVVAESEDGETTKASKIDMPCLDLSLAYYENAIAADREFKGKEITIWGTVTKIDRDMLRIPYVVINDGVRCIFSTDSEDEVIDLAVGGSAGITGICRGRVMGRVTMDQCHVAQEPDGHR